MLLNHSGKSPKIDRSAWIAPDATVCGNVTIGPGSRIRHGARVIAEARGEITIGPYCIVMDNAVLRATSRHACKIGDHCLIGPNAHVVGATLEDEVLVATAAAIFHGTQLGCGTEVQVHAVVHLRTNLPPNSIVPIGWIAVGDPPQILSPDRHDEIWAVQKPLNFPEWVYGSTRETPHLMRHVTESLSENLSTHTGDRVISPAEMPILKEEIPK
jgi:carbonic anhydrase/acetyltransferase-like protein (isoleucine patch superfamily)